MRVTSLVLAATLAACGGAQTAPEDMSAHEHREASQADQHRGELHETDWVGADPMDPGTTHFSLASIYQEHAKEHAEAARALDERLAEECAGVAEDTRRSCPLGRYEVVGVEPLPDGVRVTYAGAGSPEELRLHARCHAAYGAWVGRETEGMEACPLYGRALSITTSADGEQVVLTLRSDRPDVVERLHDLYEPVSAP